MAKKKDEVKMMVLPGAPKLYAASVGISYGSNDFRLNLVNEVVQTDQGKVGEIVGQVAMTPTVAKKLKDVLAKSINDYESKFGKIVEPKLKSKKK